MPASPIDPVVRALADALRERLMLREDIEVPGLGAFRVRHEPSRVQENEAGERTLLPPRDTVDFEAAAPSR